MHTLVAGVTLYRAASGITQLRMPSAINSGVAIGTFSFNALRTRCVLRRIASSVQIKNETRLWTVLLICADDAS